MKIIMAGILALLVASPILGQGLTITLKETSPIGQSSPILQADSTHARLDIPSMASQVLYDSATQTLRLVVPLLRTYREYTPAIVQQAAAAGLGRGEAAQTPPLTYKRTGTDRVRDWPCTTYEGFRGTEKVAEVCAAEGAAIGLSRGDFTLVQQAIDMARAIAPAEIIERVPMYGTAAVQGFNGFPVRHVSFKNGQADTTTELVEFNRGPVPAANFAVPAGFNKGQ